MEIYIFLNMKEDESILISFSHGTRKWENLRVTLQIFQNWCLLLMGEKLKTKTKMIYM